MRFIAVPPEFQETGQEPLQGPAEPNLADQGQNKNRGQ
jgi:hypothetical protein